MANRVKKTKTSDAAIVMVRLPETLKRQMAELAETNGRSMTAEVVAAIEQHLKAPGRLDSIERFLEKHRSMIESMAEYDWFGKDGVLAGLDRVEEMVRNHDEVINPNRYRDID